MVLGPNPEDQSPRPALCTSTAITRPSPLVQESSTTVDTTPGGSGYYFRSSGNCTLPPRKRRPRPNPQQQHRSSGHSSRTGYYLFCWTCCVMIFGRRASPAAVVREVRAFVPSSATPAFPQTHTRRQRLFFFSSTSTATTSDHRIIPVRVGHSSNHNHHNNNIHSNHHHQHQRQSSFASSSSASSSSSPSSSLQLLSSAVELCHVDFTPTIASSSTTRPAALFLHGLLGNKRNFDSIARSLGPQLDQPRRILGLDLRNHGAFCVTCVCVVLFAVLVFMMYVRYINAIPILLIDYCTVLYSLVRPSIS